MGDADRTVPVRQYYKVPSLSVRSTQGSGRERMGLSFPDPTAAFAPGY